MKDSLGDRIKNNYENRSRHKLTRRTPVIMRLDGKCFHTLTRGCKKPFDEGLHAVMCSTAEELCKEIQGAQIAYVQSDEISILITDFNKLDTDAWFDYNIQKMASVSASIATARFNSLWSSNGIGLFDSRVFNIPKEEVVNYFIWRQKDWERNSISMLCQANFSHKQLNGLNRTAQHELLHTKDLNWAKLENKWKQGTFIMRNRETGEWEDKHFEVIKNRQLIEQFNEVEEK